MSARNWEFLQLFGSGLSLVGTVFVSGTGEVATTLGTLYRLLVTEKRSKSWYFVFWSEMAYFSNLTALGNSHENYGISILDKNIVRLVFFTIIKVFVACKTTANYWGKVNKAISEVWSLGLQTRKVAGIN